MLKTKILVTGGAGFVGSSLAEALASNPNYEVVAVDDLTTGHLYNLPLESYSNLKFIKADCNNFRDISSIFHSNNFDYVFHYAATVGVKRTLDNPTKVLHDIEGIRNILDLSKNTGVIRVFYSSSSEVYGEPVEFPQNEHTTPLNSRLPYAIVKNLGEAFTKSYFQEFSLPFTLFRFFNTYGPRQSDDFVVARFMRAALKGQDLTIYGDGSQTRTFCYIDDNIEATIKAFEEGHFINDVINIGSSYEYSILELAQTIIQVCNSSSKIVHLPALKEGDMTRRLPNTDNMIKLLGREPMVLKVGLEKVRQAYLKNS